MSRWRTYRCGYCGTQWSMAADVRLPRCPGCLYAGYVVPVDKPAPAAETLRALAEEMRRASRLWPSGVVPPVPGSDVARWAARLEDAAAEVEREGSVREA